MSAQCLDSIKICALRATLLNNLGDIAAGPNNYATTNRELKLGWTADTDKGKDLFYRNGCDQGLAAYKSPELLKRFTTALDTFGLDPALLSILLGSAVINDGGGFPAGYEDNIQVCPADPTPPNVAIEAWSYAIDCDAQSATTPYYYHLFPLTQWQESGEWSLEVDFLKPVFAGFTRRNNQWAHGPYGGVVVGASGGPLYDNTTGASAHFLTSTPPPAAICGFGTVVPGS